MQAQRNFIYILASLILLTLVGCFPSTTRVKEKWFVASYSMSLTSVERPANAKERYGDQIVTNYNPKDSSKYKYIFEDNLVKILWLPEDHGFYFSIDNKTDNSIKIVWDESVYVDESNKSHRIIHSGVSYDKKDNPQPPSIIVRRGSIDEYVVPIDKLNFSSYLNQWFVNPLFVEIEHGEGRAFLERMAKEFVGKKVQLLLPIELQGIVNEYLFEFTVKSYSITERLM